MLSSARIIAVALALCREVPAEPSNSAKCTVSAGLRAGDVLAGVFSSSTGQLLQQVFTGQVHARVSLNTSLSLDVPSDFATCIAAGDCTLRAFIADPAAYQWEGVLCTTGQQVGMNVWVGLNAVEDFAIAGASAAFAHAYSEQDTAMGTLSLNDTTTPFPIGHPDYHRLFNLAATDGELAYFANAGKSSSDCRTAEPVHG